MSCKHDFSGPQHTAGHLKCVKCQAILPVDAPADREPVAWAFGEFVVFDEEYAKELASSTDLGEPMPLYAGTPPEQAEGEAIFDTHERPAPDAVEAARYVIATARWISDETDEDPEAIEKIRVGAELLHRLVDAAARPDPSAPLLEALKGITSLKPTEDRMPSGVVYTCDLCGASAYASHPIGHDDDCPVGIAREAIERHEGGEHG